MGESAFGIVLRRVEIISFLVLSLGLVFKLVLQFPYGAPLVVVGAGTLSIAYLIGGESILKNYKLYSERNPVLVFSGFSLAASLIAIPFKLLYWPGAMNILTVANVAVPISICLCFWLKMNNGESREGMYIKALMRLAIIYPIVIIFYLTPMSTLIAFQDRGNPELIRLKTQSYEHPQNEEYRKQLNDYWHSRGSNDSIR